jgi:phage shock protein PspC (stress-responsive transcriptional regulator)
MLTLAFSHATGTTLALLATFIGVGVIVNVLIVYIVALVIAEHRQNRERESGAG